MPSRREPAETHVACIGIRHVLNILSTKDTTTSGSVVRRIYCIDTTIILKEEPPLCLHPRYFFQIPNVATGEGIV